MVNVIEESLLFSESRYRVIFVNDNFEPIDKESKIFCRIYSSTYSDCKRQSEHSDARYFVHTIGTGIFLVFIKVSNSTDLSVNAIEGFLKYLSTHKVQDISKNVCFLMSSATDFLKGFIDNCMNSEARFYYKAIA